MHSAMADIIAQLALHGLAEKGNKKSLQQIL